LLDWLCCATKRLPLAVGTVYFFEQLLTQYGTDPDVTRLVDAYEWILVPVVNVDGFEFGWDSDSFRTWRKTRSMHAENLEAFAACELVTPGQCEGCVGTDPNRNWVSDHAHPHPVLGRAVCCSGSAALAHHPWACPFGPYWPPSAAWKSA